MKDVFDDKFFVIFAVLIIAVWSFYYPESQELAKQALAGLFGVAVGKTVQK